MDPALGIGTSIIVALLATVFAARGSRFARSQSHNQSRRTAAFVAVVALCVAPFAAMAIVRLPYIVFYSCIWIVCIAATRIARRGSAWLWLIPNITASLIACSHLVASAVLAVVYRTTLFQIAADPLTRCLAISVSAAVALVMFRILQTVLDYRIGLFSGSAKTLSWFSWIALAYIAFDALSLDIAAGSDILSLFSLLSGILLGVSIVAFLVSALRLGKSAHLEQEYLELAEASKAEERRTADLQNRAYTDALTGLASRRSAIEAMRALIAERRSFSTVFIDMNDLKTVNDTRGHAVGDACLKRLAGELRSAYGNSAIISRIGGDEFLVLLVDANRETALKRARATLESLTRPADDVPALSFCYGIIDSGENLSSPSEILNRSDLLMYEHKKAFHSEQIDQPAERRTTAARATDRGSSQ